MAEEAFYQLTKMKNDLFVIESNKIIENNKIMQNISFNEIKNNYLNNIKKYKEMLLTTFGNLFKLTGKPLFYQMYENEYHLINNNIKKIDKCIEDSKQEIIKSVDVLLTEELLKLLKDVPVEELSREKSGLKIKYLKDAGIDNMADLLGYSRYQLASIYGISEDAAYTIKNICEKYSKKVKAELKIKLSFDDKNKTASCVILAIYKYLLRIKQFDEIKTIRELYEPNVFSAIKYLKKLGNGLLWMFLSINEKEKMIEKNEYLKENLMSVYKSLINKKIDDFYLINTSSEESWEYFNVNSIEFYKIIENIYPGVLGTDDAIYGLTEELARQIQDECFFPDGLLCTLRKYQEWGVKYILHQEKVLLGDEMGLGKTIQAIATMVSLKNIGATHFLVICPASVVTNWCREIQKHSKLRVTKIHGKNKKMAFNFWVKNGGVAVTNFESTSYINLEDDFKMSLLVIDEAHYIKNAEARRSIIAREISKKAERLLFMTGTALENNVDEMISLIEVLNPNIASEINSYAFMSSAPRFREKIAPVYYRRKRQDVLTELPDKIETKEWCTLHEDEEIAYENAIMEHRFQEARRVSWNIDDLKKSSKALRLKEIVCEAENEGRKIIVFSFFLDTIQKIYDFLGGKCLNPITGSLNVNRRQQIIDEFDKAPAGTVLLAQITSGGTGLNIQSASVVVICEPQFKPSIENQAISRAYRMGQSRNVLVYRLLCENTVDEKLIELLETKQEIFDAFADKSVAAQKSFGVDEKKFGEIIEEEINRIKQKRGITEKENDMSNSNNNMFGYYNDLMRMSYKELVDFLLAKYGHAKYDYFTDNSFKVRNKKISRTSEGLYCHHIDEDKAIQLSNDKFAINNPFEYQKADRLVYCNLLEHFLLHILIAEEPKHNLANEGEIHGIGGAISFICRDLNDIYCGYTYTQQWKINVKEQVKNDFEAYILMLNRLWRLICNNDFYFHISKEDLARGYDGNIYDNILKHIE